MAKVELKSRERLSRSLSPLQGRIPCCFPAWNGQEEGARDTAPERSGSRPPREACFRVFENQSGKITQPSKSNIG